MRGLYPTTLVAYMGSQGPDSQDLPMSKPITLEKPGSSIPTIDPGVRIGHVHLKVANTTRGSRFLLWGAGFYAHHQSAGAPSYRPAAIIIISASIPGRAGVDHRPRPAPQAFTTARPFFTRPASGSRTLLRRLIVAKIPLGGRQRSWRERRRSTCGTPTITEVELYWDRPKDKWPKKPDGSLQMYTNPLDLHDLLAELDRPDK